MTPGPVRTLPSMATWSLTASPATHEATAAHGFPLMEPMRSRAGAPVAG